MYTWGFLQTDVIAFDVSVCVCVCSLRCYNSRWSCFVLYVNNRCWFIQDVQCVNADRTLPSLTLTAAGALIEVSYALVPSSLSPRCHHTHTHKCAQRTHTHVCLHWENPGEDLAHAARRLVWQWASRPVRKTCLWGSLVGSFMYNHVKQFYSRIVMTIFFLLNMPVI